MIYELKFLKLQQVQSGLIDLIQATKIMD